MGFVYDNERRIGSLSLLPEYLCPNYVDEGFAWAKEIPHEYAIQNKVLSLELTEKGEH